MLAGEPPSFRERGTMSREPATRRLLVAIAATGPLLWGAPIAEAEAVPTCFGKPATLVGTYEGTPGDDVIVFSKATGYIDGGTGNDRICVGRGGADVDGGPGRDRISGGAGWDTLDGGPGSDFLDGGRGGDVLLGGGGNDRLMGRQGSDELGRYDDRGRDTARGGPGTDIFFQFGRDFLDGGPGRDTVNAFGSDKGARVNLAAGTARGQGTATVRNIENARGSDRDDVLIGNGKGNFFTPVYGDDMIDGRGGRDTVFFDRFEDSITTGLTIDLAAGTATGAGSDTLESIEDVLGSEGPDIIRGDAGPNRLAGFYGDDSLEGGEGDDILDGDTLAGRSKHESGDSADGGPGVDACVNVEQSVSCEMFFVPGRSGSG
jgi:Ca2+-binding RTX toxin-like protein